MSKVLVFGHANPDTDSIVSAISYAYLLNQTGFEATAYASVRHLKKPSLPSIISA